ncbi:MAG: serine--tRNA ligase, partial [Dehalococcoidia bacterium]|nr:serine--tRNA ligase [Dehalococcoidia bacterium]
MLDIKLIRDNTDVVRQALVRRNDDTAILEELLLFDKRRRQLLAQVEELRAK